MGMFDSKTTALTSQEMAAGAGHELGNVLGNVIPDYQSKEQQVVGIMQTVDHEDPEQVRNAYNQILQIDPEAASEYLKQAKEFLDQRKKGTSYEMKKWSTEAFNKRTDIANEALRRNYVLTEKQINSIANSTPNRAKLHPKKAIYVHPWMDALNVLLSRIGEPNKPADSTTPPPTPAPSSIDTDLTEKLQTEVDTNALQKMNTSFTTETKALKENIRTVESGINIVNQVRGGNTAAMPQLERMLAKFNSDNRISVPEVKQVMKIGGLGARITDSIERFISGDLSPGTLNDIEEMLVRIGQLDQGNYNAKMSQYKVKYGDRFDPKTLNKWLPSSTKKFLTKAQLLELAKEKIKQRGL